MKFEENKTIIAKSENSFKNEETVTSKIFVSLEMMSLNLIPKSPTTNLKGHLFLHVWHDKRNAKYFPLHF